MENINLLIMKYIKTYEGLFSFFSKKKIDKNGIKITGNIVDIYKPSDIVDMLQEISDDFNIDIDKYLYKCRVLENDESSGHSIISLHDIFGIGNDFRMTYVNRLDLNPANAYIINLNEYNLEKIDLVNIRSLLQTKTNLYKFKFIVCKRTMSQLNHYSILLYV